MFQPRIQNRSKNMKRDKKVDDLLYNDALRRRAKSNERSKSKSKLLKQSHSQYQTPIQNKSEKLLTFKLMKEFEKQCNDFFLNNQERKFNYIDLCKFLGAMDFINNSEENNVYSAKFIQKRTLLYNIWAVLRGDRYNGINERNLLVFILAICGISAKIPCYIKLINIIKDKESNQAPLLRRDDSQSEVEDLDDREQNEAERNIEPSNFNNRCENDDALIQISSFNNNIKGLTKQSSQTKWIHVDNESKQNLRYSFEVSDDIIRQKALNDLNNRGSSGGMPLDLPDDNFKSDNMFCMNQISISKIKDDSPTTKIASIILDNPKEAEENIYSIPCALSKYGKIDIGVWDDNENISFSKEEINYISNIYHSFHIQKLTRKNHSQKFLDLANTPLVTNPEISDKSRVLADNYRQRQLEKASKFFTDANVEPPNGGKITHADLLVYVKKESTQRKKEEYKKSKEQELKLCTFKPKLMEYKKVSQLASTVKDRQTSDHQDSIYPFSDYKEPKRSVTPLGSTSRKRNEELYTLSTRNTAYKNRTDKSTNELDVEKNMSKCTFAPVINKKFEGNQSNRIRDHAKEIRNSINRMTEGRRNREITIITKDFRLNNTAVITNTSKSAMKFSLEKENNKPGFEIIPTNMLKLSQSNTNLHGGHSNKVQTKKDSISSGDTYGRKSCSPIRNVSNPSICSNISNNKKNSKELQEQKLEDTQRNNINIDNSASKKSCDGKIFQNDIV